VEHLALFILGALSLLGAAFSKLLADEFKAWVPTLVASIIAIAVRIRQPSQRERPAEEWTSHINEFPGDLSKIVAACGLVWAALKIDGPAFRADSRPLEIVFATLALLCASIDPQHDRCET